MRRQPYVVIATCPRCGKQHLVSPQTAKVGCECGQVMVLRRDREAVKASGC